VFASPTLDGKRPLWGQTMNAKFVKPAAIALGLVAGRRVFWLAPFPPKFEHLGERDDQGHHGQSDNAAPCQTRYHGDLHARELWEGVGRSARVHGTTAADEARLGVNPMKSSSHRVGHRAGNLASRTTTQLQMVESSEDKDGGRYRI
jgi:hypothetical protein